MYCCVCILENVPISRMFNGRNNDIHDLMYKFRIEICLLKDIDLYAEGIEQSRVLGYISCMDK